MKRFLALILASVALVGTAAFAGGQKEGEAPAGESLPENMWRQFEGETINVIGFNVSTFSALEELLPEFEELTGMNVEVDLYSERQGRQKQSVEIFTGSGAYDVMYFVATDWAGWIESDYIEPLDQYINDRSLTKEGEIDLDGFTQGPLLMMRNSGSLYGLPAFGATTTFYYRTDIFKEHGLEPPDTISEMMEIASQIHDDPVAAVAMRGAAGPNLWPWLSIMKGMGGNIYQDYPNDMRPALDTPEVAEAMELYGTLLRDYGIEGSATANFDEVVNALQQGDAAMSNEGAPLAVRVLDPEQSRVTGKIGFASIPRGPAGRFPPYTAHGWLIPRSSSKKEPGWLFLKWVTSTETQRQLALQGQHFAVTRTALFDDPAFREKYQLAPGFLEAYRENLDSEHFYHPINSAYTEVRNVLGQELSHVIVGNKSGEEAAQDAHEQVDQIMQDAGFY